MKTVIAYSMYKTIEECLVAFFHDFHDEIPRSQKNQTEQEYVNVIIAHIRKTSALYNDLVKVAKWLHEENGKEYLKTLKQDHFEKTIKKQFMEIGSPLLCRGLYYLKG